LGLGVVTAVGFIVGFVGTWILGLGFAIGCDGLCFDRLNYVLGAAILGGIAGAALFRFAVKRFANRNAKPSL